MRYQQKEKEKKKRKKKKSFGFRLTGTGRDDYNRLPLKVIFYEPMVCFILFFFFRFQFDARFVPSPHVRTS